MLRGCPKLEILVIVMGKARTRGGLVANLYSCSLLWLRVSGFRKNDSNDSRKKDIYLWHNIRAGTRDIKLQKWYIKEDLAVFDLRIDMRSFWGYIKLPNSIFYQHLYDLQYFSISFCKCKKFISSQSSHI